MFNYINLGGKNKGGHKRKWHLLTLIGENEEILSVKVYSHYFRNEDANACTICEVFAYIITPYRGIHHEHIVCSANF